MKEKEQQQPRTFRDYPPEFMLTWAGCANLDCMPECTLPIFCARMELAYERWLIEQMS